MSEQKIKIENGAVPIGETDYHTMFAGRSDLQKHGFSMFEIPKFGYDSRMALAIDFVKCMFRLHLLVRISNIVIPPEDPAKLVDRAFAISELIFSKGLETGWMHPLDKEAMRVLREAEEQGGFKGMLPGRG